MELSKFRKTDEIDVHHKNVTVSNIRTMVNFSNADLKKDEIKRLVTSMLFKNTGNDYSASKEEDYTNEIVKGFTYLSVNNGFIPTLFSEFLAENYKNQKEFPLNLYGWRKFSSYRTGNLKCIKLSNSVKNIPMLSENDRNMILKAEGDLDQLVKGFRGKYKEHYGGNPPATLDKYLSMELGESPLPSLVLRGMTNLSYKQNRNVKSQKMNFVVDNQQFIDDLDNDFKKNFELLQ